MMSDWRPAINQILFALTYTRALTDEVAEKTADSAIRYRSLGLGPAAYYEAIHAALASGEHLDGLGQLPQFSQEEIASFLRSLASRLDSMRPWPEPSFRRIDPALWGAFRQFQQVAEVDVPLIDLTNIFRTPFRPAGDGEDGKYVLVVSLHTGETVALVGSYARGQKALLLSQGNDDPAVVIEHFQQVTNIPPGKILPV
jgi:hypothetical protein